MQRAAEEAALQKAVTDAVKLRRQLGAYTGAVEAKAFSLPNPGGGRELLELESLLAGCRIRKEGGRLFSETG